MHALKNKIKSRRGATLTYALLLFLVAAVIGSVVLAAGTAAGGRLSQTAQMDQRYYSVNSAARLLIDTITGEEKEIKVVRTTTPSADPSGTDTRTYEYYLNKSSTPTTINETTTYPSLALVAAKIVAEEPDGDFEPKKLNLTIRAEDIDKTDDKIDLAVDAEETLYSDGSMRFKLSNANGTKKYVINVTLSADKQQTRTLDVITGAETVTTNLKWTLADIENVWNRPTGG